MTDISTNTNSTTSPAKFPITRDIQELGRIFNDRGFKLYVVGGAVRDHILGIKNFDIDLCTDAKVEEILKIFPNALKTGIKHGTVTIAFRGVHYECTTFRIDGEYDDARHPNRVEFTTDLHLDLSRRDFSINALAADARTGEIVDDFNGVEDLRAKLVRAVGDAGKRFEEDALRMLRGVRIANNLDFDIEPVTLAAICQFADNIRKVSKERIQAEISKTFETPKPCAKGFYLLWQTRLLKQISEKVFGIFSIDIEKRNKVLSILSQNSSELNEIDPFSRHCIRLVSIFLTLFGARTASIQDKINAELHGLHFSNKHIRFISLLCANLIEDRPYSRLDLKRVLSKIPANSRETYLVFLRYYFCNSPMIESNLRLMREIMASSEPIDLASLAIRGEDVIGLGFEPKRTAELLNFALERVIEDPSLNEREVLLRLLAGSR